MGTRTIGRSMLVAGILALTATLSAAGQSTSPRAFEVATVRATVPGTAAAPARPQAQRVLPSRIDFANTSLRTLVVAAFRLDSYELSAPDWLSEVRFDIQATYPAGATQADVPEMLQTLLRERFGLVSHVEPRRMDAYELIVGKDGPKMREVEPVDEVGKDFVTATGQRPNPRTDSLRETVDGPMRTMVIPGEVGNRTVTNRSLYETRTTLNRTTLVDAVRISMREFSAILRSNLNRPVIDRTGLTGFYQFKAELDVSQTAVQILRNIDGNSVNEPTGVSTFKAVEGLGLKLEERRTPVDVFVVDKIARTPTEN